MSFTYCRLAAASVVWQQTARATAGGSSASSMSAAVAAAVGTAAAAATLAVVSSTSSRTSSCEAPPPPPTRRRQLFRREEEESFASSSSKIPKAHLKKRMTAIGRLAWQSETAWNPSVTVAALTLRGGTRPLTVDDFCRQWTVVGNMNGRHPRLAWTVVGSRDDNLGIFDASASAASSASANDDPTTVTRSNLPVAEGLAPPADATVGRRDLLARVAALQLTPLDLATSTWKAWILPQLPANVSIDGQAAAEAYHDDDNDKSSTTSTFTTSNNDKKNVRSMMLMQFHHVIADGVSVSAALLDLADEADEIRGQIVEQVAKRRKRAAQRTWWQRLTRAVRFGLWLVWGSLESIARHVAILLRDNLVQAGSRNNPWHQLRRLCHPQAPTRTVAVTQACDLAQAKWVAKVLSKGSSGDGKGHSGKRRSKTKKRITVNDIFVAAVAGALGKQLEAHRRALQAKQEVGQDDGDARKHYSILSRQRNVTVAVPVHLKGGVMLPNQSIGNAIGAFLTRVPGEQEGLSAEARLAAVHASLSAAKNSPAAMLSYGVAQIVTRTVPSSWAAWLYGQSNAGVTCVVSNVRGPDRPIHYQGRRVESAYGLVPIPPGIPVGVSVFSYNGRLAVSVTAESWAIPDGDQFLVWILEEYKSLVQAARQKEKESLAAKASSSSHKSTKMERKTKTTKQSSAVAVPSYS